MLLQAAELGGSGKWSRNRERRHAQGSLEQDLYELIDKINVAATEGWSFPVNISKCHRQTRLIWSSPSNSPMRVQACGSSRHHAVDLGDEFAQMEGL